MTSRRASCYSTYVVRIGHRGAMGYEPENTLRSFKKALDLGVDMVELDVCTLKDDSLVVFHDNKLDRTTNGTGYIWDQNLEDIKKLDAGKGEQVPTLTEVFDLVNRSVPIIIELKGEGTANLVAALIQKYVKEYDWEYTDFIISSFNHHELKAFHDTLPHVKNGALTATIPLSYAQFAEELGSYAVNADLACVNKAFVDDTHRRGMKFFVYTVNDYDDIERMREMGVDGIFSNYPDRVT